MLRLAPPAMLLLVLFSASSAAAETAEWPRWRGPDGNGIAAGMSVNPKALAGQPKIAWKSSLGTGFSSVAVAGGRVYALGNTDGTDTVFCLNVETGRVLWKHSYRCAQGSYPGPRATPTVHEGVVYTLSREGHLFALDAATGRVRWQKHLADDLGIRSPQWDFAGSVVVAGDLLVLNAGQVGARPGPEHRGDGLGERNGARRVRDPGARRARGQTRGGDLRRARRVRRGRRRRNGAVVVPLGDAGSDVNAADPVVLRRPCLRGFRLRQGLRPVRRLGRPARRGVAEQRLRDPLQQLRAPWTASCTASTATRGFRTAESCGAWTCVTGKTAWSAPLGFGSLVATRDHLVVLNSAGTIIVAEASSAGYRELARSALPRNQYWTPPALAAGRLFVRNLTGDLFAIDVR